jgi:hypothetical protein
LARNNFAPTTLDFASPFTNLKNLTLGTRKDKVQAGIYNRFYGSLEPLKNLTKLQLLCLASTDVDSGLEYLFIPERLKQPGEKITMILDCRSQVPNVKVRTIKEQLKPFNYDLWAWQLAHPEKMRPVRPEYFAEKELWEKWLSRAITDAEKQFTENQHNSNLKPKNIESLKSRLKLLQEAQTNYLKNPFSPPNLPNNNSPLSVIKADIKNQILDQLKKNKLKIYDLPGEYQNWEKDLEKLDSESKIKEFKQKIWQAIQSKKDKTQNSENNKDKNFSWPVKLLMGGGAIVVILGLVVVIWHFSKKKKNELTTSPRWLKVKCPHSKK